MLTKYVRMLSAGCWLKAGLPLYVLLVVFFLRGTVTQRIDTAFHARMNRVMHILSVQMGADNAAFADALARETDLKPHGRVSYSSLLGTDFIKRMDNRPDKPEQPAEGSKKALQKAKPGPAPVYKVTGVFVGKLQKFAVVNDKMVKIGDKLKSGEKVTEIQNSRILLKGRWGDRWLYVNY